MPSHSSPLSEGFRYKVMPIGYKHTTETKKKISESHKGKGNPMFGKCLSEIHRNRISKANKGRKFPKEFGEKISKRMKGKDNPMFGKHHSKETKRRISEAHKGHPSYCPFPKGHQGYWLGKKREDMIGENHFNWQGGKSFKPYSIDWTETLRRSIRERDNYICQICNQYGYPVHHIDYDKKNCDPDNLITLCRSCHTKTNYNRNYWIKYFNNRKQNERP